MDFYTQEKREVFLKEDFEQMEKGELFCYIQILLLRYFQECKIEVGGEPVSQKDLQEKLIRAEADYRRLMKWERSEDFSRIMKKTENYQIPEELILDFWRGEQNSFERKEGIRRRAETIIHEIFFEKYFEDSTLPKWLCSLTVRLLDSDTETFCDSTSGTGGMAEAALEYEEKKGKKLKLYAQEKEPLLCAVFMILNLFRGIQTENVFCADVLKTPPLSEAGELMKFGRLVAFSPLNKERYLRSLFWEDSYGRFPYGAIGGKNMDWLYAQHQLASLEERGTGAVVMFSGSLFNTQCKEIREAVCRTKKISSVISLPPNTLSCIALPLSIVVFKEQENEKILMIDAEKILRETRSFRYGEKLNMPEKAVDRILDIYSRREELSQISRLVGVKEIEEGVLFPPRYIEKQYIETELFGKVCVKSGEDRTQEKKLGEIGTFYRGINTSVSASRLEEGDVGILKLADVQQGKLVLDGIDFYRCKENVKTEKYRIQEGDLLFSCKGPSVKLCAVPRHRETILISQTFIGFRVNEKLCDSTYLQRCLESPLGLSQLKNKQLNSSIVMLGVKDLKDISFPCPSLEEQKRMVMEWEEQEKRIKELEEEIRVRRRQQAMGFYEAAGIAERLQFEKI